MSAGQGADKNSNTQVSLIQVFLLSGSVVTYRRQEMLTMIHTINRDDETITSTLYLVCNCQ